MYKSAKISLELARDAIENVEPHFFELYPEFHPIGAIYGDSDKPKAILVVNKDADLVAVDSESLKKIDQNLISEDERNLIKYIREWESDCDAGRALRSDVQAIKKEIKRILKKLGYEYDTVGMATYGSPRYSKYIINLCVDEFRREING